MANTMRTAGPTKRFARSNPRPDGQSGVLVDLQGPKLRIGRFAEGSIMLAGGASFTLDLDPSPGSPQRVALPPSGGLRRHQAGDEPPPRRRQGPAAGRDVRRELCRHARKGRRSDFRPQGSEHSRRGTAHLPADRQGPGGPRLRARAGSGLGGGVVHPAATGPAHAARSDRQAGRSDDEDREACGARQSRGDDRAVRRDHGRARRPRRRVAARRRPEHLAGASCGLVATRASR